MNLDQVCALQFLNFEFIWFYLNWVTPFKTPKSIYPKFQERIKTFLFFLWAKTHLPFHFAGHPGQPPPSPLLLARPPARPTRMRDTTQPPCPAHPAEVIPSSRRRATPEPHKPSRPALPAVRPYPVTGPRSTWHHRLPNPSPTPQMASPSRAPAKRPATAHRAAGPHRH